MQYSRVHGFGACCLYPFMGSMGDEVCDPKTGPIQGLLNTYGNAKAMEEASSCANRQARSTMASRRRSTPSRRAWRPPASRGANCHLPRVDVGGVIVKVKANGRRPVGVNEKAHLRAARADDVFQRRRARRLVE
jgi:hypothetical protein